MHASIGVTGYPRSGKLPAPLCHRSPALSQTVRGGRLTPAAASRSSKSIGVTGYPRSGKPPAPARHLSRALSQTVRGHGDAAPTRRTAPSRSARLGSSPILKSDYRRRSSTPCVQIRGCLRSCVCVHTIAVGCPSFTLCQELNTEGRFERSMVEHRSHLPSSRVKRGVFRDGLPAVSSNAATQGLGREEYRAGLANVGAQIQRQVALIAREVPPRAVDFSVKFSLHLWSWLATQAPHRGSSRAKHSTLRRISRNSWQ